MTLLLIDQNDDDVLIVTDTLVVSDDHTPAAFRSKVWTLPHLNMVIAATGTANVAEVWANHIAGTGLSRDIEALNEHAPDALPKIYAHVQSGQDDPIGRSTIYHLGFPIGGEKVVRYIYRSENNFQPERHEGSGDLLVKPMPPGFDATYPTSTPEFIELATRLREANETTTGGVPIGGDIYATLVQNGHITTQHWHRFPDYEDAWHAMLRQRHNPAPTDSAE